MARVGSRQQFTLRELSDPDVAANHLAECLRRGELALLLGAGVSKGSGLPDWAALVEGCEAAIGIDTPDGLRTSEQLMASMASIRRAVLEDGGSDQQFRALVRDNLYTPHQRAANTYPDNSLQDLLLIAIGAMIMSSSRGSIREVVTLNFDDLLEWYLALHGFTSQSVTRLPNFIRADVDVVVFHAHGYLPLRAGESPSDWLVLTREEFVKRVSQTSGRAWPRFITNLAATKRFLAIGTGFQDLDLEVAIDAAGSERTPGEGPSGFVINAKFNDDDAERLLQMGLVPVAVGTYGAIPHFLLGVCRQAAVLAPS